jgi:hypothetical protein
VPGVSQDSTGGGVIDQGRLDSPNEGNVSFFSQKKIKTDMKYLKQLYTFMEKKKKR